VTNILIVVVRYFGGTLLGVPGLINAYKSAAAEALGLAEIIEKTVNERYAIRFDYLIMNDVMRLIKEEQLNVLEQQFDNDCSIVFEVRKSQLNKVLQRIEKQAGIESKYLGTT
ncbi:MAG: YigZ family protein, partial [Pedobacter sp.]|uniref:YigZ family protein n=1 Tax=Pedobacter sp. TaxID=1411316 RepID=UPI00339AB8B4